MFFDFIAQDKYHRLWFNLNGCFLMLLFMLLLFFLEIAAFVEVGGEIGALSTILIIILTFMAGIYAFKHYTFLMASARGGNKRENVDALFHGFCGLFAGVLLIIPGFVSDLLGALLLVPFVRVFLRTFILDSIVGGYTFGLMDTDDLKDMKGYYDKKRHDYKEKKAAKGKLDASVVDADFEVIDPKDDSKK